MSTYPDLVTYVVAIACDFTGRRRVAGGAISDGKWGEWDRRVKQWQAKAANKNRSVEFIPWTADELGSFLMPSEAGGLRAYWFNATEFSDDWFKRRIELAVADLEERYNPEDHVDVQIQSLFEFIIRHPKARRKLAEQFQAVKAHSFPEQLLHDGQLKPSDELIRGAIDAIENVMQTERELIAPPWQPWDVEKWGQLAHQAAIKVREVGEWARNAQANFNEPKQENTRRQLQSTDYELGELYNEIYSLEDLTRRRYMKAEAKRAALIAGRAGTGKSHLLARVAELAVSEKRPVVFILGQQIRERALWPQILERLELWNVTAEDFLGALDAAAESKGVRGLILVDALNEGAGARVWRTEIGSFLAQINKYPNLACILSCRSEYVDYLVPTVVLDAIPLFEVRGFQTAEEQANAARVYLDKRGLSRPATPWLTPEFINPLFLRSSCNALMQQGKTEFPRGLTGTKEIFAFFLDSVGRHLGAGRDGTSDLVGPTKATLLDIAMRMAEGQKDYLDRKSAEEIADDKFKPFKAPTGLTWLEVIQRNGLLRFDPDPKVDPANPLHLASDVVRFSFQRFQDHLMAEVLLANVTDVKAEFAARGCLCFIHDGTNLRWEWRGLVDAFSIQLPEQFEMELVDVLPGSAANWWRISHVRDAFAESVRWRATTAFTARSLELLNRLFGSRLPLLIELSASVDHPWNAQLIHRNLIRRQMTKRDAFWTVALNKAMDAESHPIHRLIDWCLSVQQVRAMRETQWLCALVLTWCFTSSNRQVRDRATKALTAILLNQQDIFPQLSDAFRNVDDLYLLERLYAAAYGACCIDPSHERMNVYAQKTFINVFSQKTPFLNLLLRDHARGIVELANHIGALPKEVEIARSRPPYASALPRLSVTDTFLKKVAEKAGDNAILHSSEGMGDFGRYEIARTVSKFVAVKLSNLPPYTSREKFEHFENQVVRNHSRRIAALERLRKVNFSGTRINIQFFGKKRRKLRQPSKAAMKRHATQVRTAEQNFLALLTSEERKRYRVDAKPWLNSATEKNSEPLQVDVAAAQRWVAKKAYDYGWTKRLFQKESGPSYEYKNERSLVERIGKKYQWLALSELLSRLSDNYWIGGTHGDGTRKYDNPTDIGFLRDIDPTVLPSPYGDVKDRAAVDAWIRGPDIIIPPTAEDELTKWPFIADPGAMLPSLIHRNDVHGTQWITLYDYRTALDRYEPRRDMLHGLRQQEFRFVLSVVVSRVNTARFIDQLKNSRHIDVMHWDPPEFTDGPYVGEAPWRATWPTSQWQSDDWRTPKEVPIAFPVSRYVWESQLDASLPEGAGAFVPSPWLTINLVISPDPTDISIYRDSSGKCQFIGTQRGANGSAAVIGAEIFNDYLDRHALDCIWLFVAERGVWPGGDNSKAAWRRTEGVCVIEGGKPKASTWNEDRINGR